MKKYLLFSILITAINITHGQTTYLPLNTDEYHLLDRLETMTGVLSEDFYSTIKPIPRKGAIDFLAKQKRIGSYQQGSMTNIDYYNIERALSISGEWSSTADGDDGAINSFRPILKYFYEKQPDLVHVNEDDFFLVVNPVVYAQVMKESNVDGWKYTNTRGAEIRGRIFNRVGFYTMFADNQEQTPSYTNAQSAKLNAFPGNDYYTNKSNGGYDYLIARGYVDVGGFKDHFTATFGYDKNFNGDGMRSLQISDFGAPATFLRLRTKIWKLMFENLYLELTPDYVRGSDTRLPHKYATLNQVSMNVNSWLNLGIFESTMFGKKDRFGVEYLVPVIFYNTAARALGADQKTSLGFNFKAIALNKFQIYGQGYFDRLSLSDITKSSWKNQYGLQLGAKYFNAFTLHNLDLQGEVNMVRPFTYSSNDGVTDYTHYNQPLAHPFGSGFAEIIGIARYQPLRHVTVSGKAIYSMRGTDSLSNVNYGNDIFKYQDSRVSEEDINLTAGKQMKGLYLNLNVAYEVRPNIYLEAGGTTLQRKYSDGISLPTSTFFYGGLRWNIARREYDSY